MQKVDEKGGRGGRAMKGMRTKEEEYVRWQTIHDTVPGHTPQQNFWHDLYPTEIETGGRMQYLRSSGGECWRHIGQSRGADPERWIFPLQCKMETMKRCQHSFKMRSQREKIDVHVSEHMTASKAGEAG